MQLIKIFALLLVVGIPQASPANEQCPPLLNYSSTPLLGGEAVNFCQAYRGKVILAVNTASQCGYTPQFKGLESLYQEYKTRGLVVLGFPSNDFKQEHEDPKETAKVSFQQYGVTFPMFAKTQVSLNGANPFFTELARQSGVTPQWNFQKYLINRSGQVVKTYPASVTPEDILLRLDIESILADRP